LTDVCATYANQNRRRLLLAREQDEGHGECAGNERSRNAREDANDWQEKDVNGAGADSRQQTGSARGLEACRDRSVL